MQFSVWRPERPEQKALPLLPVEVERAAETKPVLGLMPLPVGLVDVLRDLSVAVAEG